MTKITRQQLEEAGYRFSRRTPMEDVLDPYNFVYKVSKPDGDTIWWTGWYLSEEAALEAAAKHYENQALHDQIAALEAERDALVAEKNKLAPLLDACRNLVAASAAEDEALREKLQAFEAYYGRKDAGDLFELSKEKERTEFNWHAARTVAKVAAARVLILARQMDRAESEG